MAELEYFQGTEFAKSKSNRGVRFAGRSKTYTADSKIHTTADQIALTKLGNVFKDQWREFDIGKRQRFKSEIESLENLRTLNMTVLASVLRYMELIDMTSLYVLSKTNPFETVAMTEQFRLIFDQNSIANQVAALIPLAENGKKIEGYDRELRRIRMTAEFIRYGWMMIVFRGSRI